VNPIRAAIVTMSDRCSAGQAIDTSGPALAEMVRYRLGGEIVSRACVPDDRQTIADLLRRLTDQPHAPDLILTTGGTGLSPRDVTPEATLDVLERRHSGLMELIRLRCYPTSPRAFLSRGEAGTRGRTLIINLPGSERGAVESLEALLDLLPHAIETLRGHAQNHTRPDADSPLESPPYCESEA
jgi:molybdenum cofactor synthesis domain-containing protein